MPVLLCPSFDLSLNHPLKRHAGPAEPFRVARPEAVGLQRTKKEMVQLALAVARELQPILNLPAAAEFRQERINENREGKILKGVASSGGASIA